MRKNQSKGKFQRSIPPLPFLTSLLPSVEGVCTGKEESVKADAWQAIFSGGTFGTALIASRIGLVQLTQFNKQRREETRPYIIVDFLFRESLICISAQNIGRSPAAQVTITFEPELASSHPDIAATARAALSKPIPLMAPKRKMVWLLDSSASAFQNTDTVPHSYKAKVSYSELTSERPRFPWLKMQPPIRYTDPEQSLHLQQYEGALVKDLNE